MPRQDERGFCDEPNREALIRCRRLKPFETKTLGEGVDATAPDGTAVRLLLSLAGGSMAHFELPAGAVSHAVTHRTVEEIWFVVGGRGQHLAPSGRRGTASIRSRPGRR